MRRHGGRPAARQPLLVSVQEVMAPFHAPCRAVRAQSDGGLAPGRRAPLEDGDELRGTDTFRRGAENWNATESVRRAGISAARATASASGSIRFVPRAQLEEKLDRRGLVGATGTLTRSATWSASRFIAGIRALGHAARNVDAILAAWSSTCSRASRKRRTSVWRYVKSRARADRSRERRRRFQKADGIVRAARPREIDEPDASRNSGSRERAASTAGRLLPTPGAPVGVTRRCSCRTPET